MNFGQNYFDVLASRIGGASNIWNRQGLSHLSSRSRTTGAHGVSKTTGIGAGSRYFGLSVNTIKAMNSVYNPAYSSSLLSDQKVAQGAVKVENAGKKLAGNELYEEKNTQQLLKTIENFVDGFNGVSSNARNTTNTLVRNRAGWMREDVLNNMTELKRICIGYNTKTGELSLDAEALKSADKGEVKKTLGGYGAVGQRLKNNAALTSQAAIVSSRYSVNSGLYGADGRYGFGSFLGGLWL